MKPQISASVLLFLLLFVTVACGKTEQFLGSKDMSASVPAAPMSLYHVTGVLSDVGGASSRTNLAPGERAILAFKLSRGQVSGVPVQVPLGVDGSFVVPVSTGFEALSRIDQAIASDGLIEMKFHAKIALPQHASKIDAETDLSLLRNELQIFRSGVVSDVPSYLMVVYERTGDRVAEALSFRFIGMPTSAGKLLSHLPVTSLRGNVNLGVIALSSGDEAVAQQYADASVFNLPSAVLEEYAALGDSLKVVRNYWMNADTNGDMNADVDLTFLWKVSNPADVRDKYTPPISKPLFDGTTLHLNVHDVGATFDDLCALLGQQEFIRLEPPQNVSIAGVSTPFNAVNALSNAGIYSRKNLYGGTLCESSEKGAAHIRNDDPANGANREMTLAWEGLEGSLPAGIWYLKYGGLAHAAFDFSSFFPLNSLGYPKVYIPVFNFSTENNTLMRVDVKFYLYSDGSFREIFDASVIEKNTHSMIFDLKCADGSNCAVMHANERNGAVFANGIFSYIFAPAERVKWSDLSMAGFQYSIAANKYRMEYQPR